MNQLESRQQALDLFYDDFPLTASNSMELCLAWESHLWILYHTGKITKEQFEYWLI